MVMAFVTLIIYGRKTIDDVPRKLKQAVLDELAAIGLDGYGNPIE